MFYQVSVINQKLCSANFREFMAVFYLRFKLSLEVGDYEIQTCI